MCTEDRTALFRKPIRYERPLTFLLGYRHVIPQRLLAFSSCATTELVNVMKVAALLLRNSLYSARKHSCCLSQLCGGRPVDTTAEDETTKMSSVLPPPLHVMKVCFRSSVEFHCMSRKKFEFFCVGVCTIYCL